MRPPAVVRRPGSKPAPASLQPSPGPDPFASLTRRPDYPVTSFNGTKSIVVSTVSWIGGKNAFLGWCYVGAAALFVLLGLAGTVRHLIKPRCVVALLGFLLGSSERRPDVCGAEHEANHYSARCSLATLARPLADGSATCRSSAGTRASKIRPAARSPLVARSPARLDRRPPPHPPPPSLPRFSISIPPCSSSLSIA